MCCDVVKDVKRLRCWGQGVTVSPLLDKLLGNIEWAMLPVTPLKMKLHYTEDTP